MSVPNQAAKDQRDKGTEGESPAHNVAYVDSIQILAPEYLLGAAGPHVASAQLSDGLDVRVLAGDGSVELKLILENGEPINLRFRSAACGRKAHVALLRGFEILTFLFSRRDSARGTRPFVRGAAGPMVTACSSKPADSVLVGGSGPAA